MPFEFKWKAPETLAGYFTTEMNSIVNSTSDTTGFTALGAEIDNTTDLFQYINLELVLAAQGVARSAGATVEVWIAVAVDPSNYPDTANAALMGGFFAAFALDAATTARRLTLYDIPIPPLKFKLYLRNRTGQTWASSGNTFKTRRHNEQSV